MKRKLTACIVGIGYLAVLFCLLLVQMQSIIGNLERIFATIAAFILVIPTVVLLRLYINLKYDKQQVNEQQANEQQTNEQQANEQQAVKLQADKPVVLTYDEFDIISEKNGLSRREREVAWLMYKGYTNMQIAEQLFISVTTVKKHATHIFEKMNVMSRKELKSKINE